MKTKLILLSVLLLTVSLALTLTAYAAIPHLMNFQGKATDKAGAPLNGTFNLTFRIYNSETGGTPKWTEAQPNILISNGIFQVQLGSVNPLNLPFDESYWISIEINTDGEMLPRTRLASVGYAYMAETSYNNNMPAGSVVQVVNYQVGGVATGTTLIPYDDTIPQKNEGDEYMTLTITPKSATNKLLIEVLANITNSNNNPSIALFQDDIDDALAVSYFTGYSEWLNALTLKYYMTANTVLPTTFKIRGGGSSSGTTTFNGASGARKFGGAYKSGITITEIKG